MLLSYQSLPPKLVKRMSAITSRPIIIPKRWLINVLVMLHLRKHHCNGHKCDIKELFIIPVDLPKKFVIN